MTSFELLISQQIQVIFVFLQKKNFELNSLVFLLFQEVIHQKILALEQVLMPHTKKKQIEEPQIKEKYIFE